MVAWLALIGVAFLVLIQQGHIEYLREARDELVRLRSQVIEATDVLNQRLSDVEERVLQLEPDDDYEEWPD